MPYPQTDWKDHVTEYENRYTEITNPDGSITHTKVEGEVIQQGTPMSATNFNHQEEGIGAASMLADLLYSLILLKLGHSDHTLETLDAAKLDVNGKAADAAKADKLGAARTIALTGGATAVGVSFDGSANITITVTALDPTKLSAAVAIAKGGTGATDAAGARTNLGVPAISDLETAAILTDAQHAIDQAIQRDLEDRLYTAEAQLSAMAT